MLADIIIVLLIGGALAAIIRKKVKDWKAGKTSCSGCSGCGGGCAGCSGCMACSGGTQTK